MSRSQAVNHVLHVARDGAVDALPSFRFANAWCVVLGNEDPDYGDLLRGPGLNFADGSPVARLARKATGTDAHVRGPSFFEDLLGRGLGIRHYFYGGSADTIAKLQSEVARRFPDAVIAGAESPAIGTAEELASEDALACIVSAHPDIVWVGLGTPKQDYVARAISERLGIATAAVGAAFDFTAGTVREAPRWVRAVHMEWLFRLASEPRRLWRRYLIGNVKFLRLVGWGAK